MFTESSCKDEPGDVNNFTQSFAHILLVLFFCVTYYSINGVIFPNKKLTNFY